MNPLFENAIGIIKEMFRDGGITVCSRIDPAVEDSAVYARTSIQADGDVISKIVPGVSHEMWLRHLDNIRERTAPVRRLLGFMKRAYLLSVPPGAASAYSFWRALEEGSSRKAAIGIACVLMGVLFYFSRMLAGYALRRWMRKMAMGS